jgi:hypothetical protein
MFLCRLHSCQGGSRPSPTCRRQNFQGEQGPLNIMDTAGNRARKKNARWITLNVFNHNEHARKVYEDAW